MTTRFFFAVSVACGVISCTPQSSPESPAAGSHAARKAEKTTVEKPKPLPRSQRGEVTSISLEKFFELQQSGKAYIIDARPTFFYKLGHIPGAVSMPAHMGPDSYIDAYKVPLEAAIAAGKPVIVYCTNLMCKDARTFSSYLSKRGYSCAVFQGGWDAWKDAEMPTE